MRKTNMAFTYCKLLLTLALLTVTSVDGSHFRGGIIQWKTLEDIVEGQDLRVEITYRLAWRHGHVYHYCSQGDIDNQVLQEGQGNLDCKEGCLYEISMTSMSYYCTDFSDIDEWLVGEKSFEYLIPPVAMFEASYASGDWIPLVIGGGTWEVRVRMNLNQTLTSGRRQNASPVTKMSPVLRLQHGCNHTIIVPVEDADDDDVRCRWAEGDLGECAGVCGVLPGALDRRQCTIQYNADGELGYYAVAVQVEDFATTTDTVPLSSVPLQFLVYVYASEEECYNKPDFDFFTEEDGSCIGIPPNTTFTDTLTAVAGGPGVQIADITTQSPPGLTKSALQQGEAPHTWYVNITWTPTPQQSGPNIFCFLASDSTQRDSDQRCVTLLAGVYPPSVLPQTTLPVGKVRPDHSTWTLSYDRPIYRPKRTAYIRFIHLAALDHVTEFFSIDASTSTEVVFADPAVSYQLTVNTGNLNFIEKEVYFILLDDGVVVGGEYCGPESRRIWDPIFWIFLIKDITPPEITFIDNPTLTGSNLSVSWFVDEEATVVCTLQDPDATSPVPCDNSTYSGEGLGEGYHTLYIQASDAEGNSVQRQHTWYVDLSPPDAFFSITPSSFSRENDANFRFSCIDNSKQHVCTYTCRLDGGAPASCEAQHQVTGLSEAVHNVSVSASDYVGNVGPEVIHVWTVDNQGPTLGTLPNRTVSCGDPITPTALGIPTIYDVIDPNPTLTYVDSPGMQCVTVREWRAADAAGNERQLYQYIAFVSELPAQVGGPVQVYIACGSVDTLADTDYLITRGLLTVAHPCERGYTISYSDSAPVEGCGVDFTRRWTVTDDCGQEADYTQHVRVLTQSDPDEPQDGQVNVPLDQPLRWPSYPGATRYNVYVWCYGQEEPLQPTGTVDGRVYVPAEPYPPNTRMLWRIGYLLPPSPESLEAGGNDTQEIPSPVWGLVTAAFPDLEVTDLMTPETAFSGSVVTFQWRVENVGNISTSGSTKTWYDQVYIGVTDSIGEARLVRQVAQARYVDPSDGFLSEAEVTLADDDIGNYYVFVKVDAFSRIDDYSRSNNELRSLTPIRVQLTPPPNLEVVSVYTLGQSFSGQPTSVSWRVRNSGVGITAAAAWSDTVYISDDVTLDGGDVRLTVEEYDGQLISGAEYSASTVVTMPNAIYGTYYLIVTTDHYGEVYEHTDEGDNTKLAEIQVTLSATPDLVVHDVEPSQTTASTGETLTITSVVRNAGGGRPFQRWWMDTVTIVSTSTRITYHTEEAHISQDLPPGGEYSRHFDYQIPAHLPSGLYNITVTTDSDNNVFEFEDEDNNANNAEVTITRRLPDLEFSHGTASISTTEYGTYLIYNITIRNNGPGIIFGTSWVDGVFLSDVRLTSSSTAFPILQRRLSHELHKDATYTIFSASYILDPSVSGQHTVYVKTDFGDDITEADEANNFIEVGAVVVPPRTGRVVIAEAEVSATVATSGTDLYLSWTVRNAGNLGVAYEWFDSVYLKRVPTPSSPVSPVTLLRRRTYRSGLGPNANYTTAINITIPLDAAGSYQIVIKAAENINAVTETANVYSSDLLISSAPSPDLQVYSISYDFVRNADGTNSRTLSIQVDAVNTGNSFHTEMTWSDRVILRERTFNTIMKNIVQTTSTVSLSIPAAETYSITYHLVIPAHVGGYYDLVAEVDYKNDVTEAYGEQNNIKVHPTPIELTERPKPNLEVALTSPDAGGPYMTGEQVTFEYMITNTGGSNIETTSWTDAVYLYNKEDATRLEIQSFGFRIGSSIRNYQLAIGEYKTWNITVTIPHGQEDNLYLYILPDDRDQFALSGGSPVFFAAAPLDVQRSLLPDLIVSLDGNTGNATQSGQTLNVTFSVSNVGNGSSVGIWYDSVYLSEDPLLDPFDAQLKASANPRMLLTDDSYQQSVDVFIPFDLLKSKYYIIVETNIKRTIFEETTDNNIGWKLITIVSSPAVDIVTTDVTHSETDTTYNDPVMYQWNIQNNGSLPFSGYKCDTVYLSPDDTWDIEDISVGEPRCGSFSLDGVSSGDDTIQHSLTSLIPQVMEGSYKTIVRTRTNARDVNLENNIGMSVGDLQIAPPEIAMYTQETMTITGNSNIVLKITEVPTGVALLVILTTSNDKAYHQLYLKFASPPKPFDYESLGNDRITLTQQVYVGYTRGPYYYLLVESLTLDNLEYEVDIEVKEAIFELNSIYPVKVSSFGSSTIRLNGMLFARELRVCVYRLSASNQLCAQRIYRVNSDTAYATFDFESVSIGRYTIEMTDLEISKSTKLVRGLELSQLLINGKLEFEILPTSRAFRLGEDGIFTVNIHNVGYNDIPTPIIVVSSVGDTMIGRIDTDESVAPSKDILFLPMVKEEPGYTIPPRTSRTFAFRASPEMDFLGSETIIVGPAPSMELEKFLQSTLMSLIPPDIPQSAWNVIYNNFVSCSGEDVNSFEEYLREYGHVMNQYTSVGFTIQDLINDFLLIADGRLINSNIMRVVDAIDSTTVNGVPLKLERIYPNSLTIRRTTGLFGYGWTVPWLEMKLTAKNETLILMKERKQYLFYETNNGGYRSKGLKDITISRDGTYFHFSFASIIFTFSVASGNLQKMTDANGPNTIVLDYQDDKLKRLSHFTGSQIQFEYGHTGIVKATLLDANDIHIKEVTYFYNSNGFLTDVIVGNEVVTYGYNTDGDLIEVTYVNGETDTLEYDEHFWFTGIQTKSVSGDIITHETYSLTCYGEVIVSEQTLAIESTFHFGNGGQLLCEKPSTGLPIAYSYNTKINSFQLWIGDDIFTAETYDELSRTSTKTYANGDSISVQFNAKNELSQIYDGNGMIRTFSYLGNRLEKIACADESFKMFEHNDKGLLKKMVLEDASTIEFDYDGKGNMIHRETLRDSYDYSYDKSNRIIGIQKGGEETTIAYTPKGLPAQVVYPDGTELTYTYNEHGQRASLSINTDDYTVMYQYDSKRRLSHMINKDGVEIVRFEYDGTGHLSRRILGNGLYTNYTYQPNTLRLTHVDNYNWGGELLSSFEYQYNSRGFRTAMITSYATYLYRYDASGQLTHWEIAGGPSEDITYDSRQNRLFTKSGGGDPITYQANDVNQFLSVGEFQTFKYDKLGNLIENAEQRGQNTLLKHYTYDQEKRLIRYEDKDIRCEYEYDAFGSMSKKSCSDEEDISYVNDPFGVYGSVVLLESSGTDFSRIYHANEYGVVAMAAASSNISYLLFDGDGSTAHIADHIGGMLGSYKYAPFGGHLQEPSDDRNPYQFMGKYGVRSLCDIKDVYLMGARLYDAGLARFLSKDPLDIIGSPPNSYVYANNNPVSFHDPHGLIFFHIGLILRPIVQGAITSAAVNAVTQSINIYNRGGSFSDFSWKELGKSALSGAVSGIAGPIVSKIPNAITKTVAGGALGGFLGGATSDVLNGKPFDFGSNVINGLLGGATSLLPKSRQFALNVFQGLDKGALINTFSEHYRQLKPLFPLCVKCAFPGLDPGTWLLPPWLSPGSTRAFINWVQSFDPNDILGPSSHGDSQFVAPFTDMEYKIRFENNANATAPAQRVTIRAPLDFNLNPSSFRLGSFSFGTKVVNLYYTSPFNFIPAVDDTEESGTFVSFQAGFDNSNDEAEWILQTIDPETGAPPTDPSIGFLPPNNGTSGQGYVTFVTRNHAAVRHLAKVDAFASIVFDANAPIDTPLIFRTIDSAPPEARLNLSSVLPSSAGLLVEVDTADSGSGVRSFDVFRVNNDSAPELLLAGVTESPVLLPVEAGAEHKVIAIATDNVGNVQEFNLDKAETIIFSLDCPNNCSGNGECLVTGHCACVDGYVDSDCSAVDNRIDPPVLDISFDTDARENETIALFISARAAEPAPDLNIFILIRNLTAGAVFDSGMTIGDELRLESAEFGAINVKPPEYFSGILQFVVVANVSSSDVTAARESSVAVPVQAVANEPTLSVTASCFHPTTRIATVNVMAELTDQDGSEVLSITSAGRTWEAGGNTITVQPNVTEYTLNVTAVSTEVSNGAAAAVTIAFTTAECDGSLTTPTAESTKPDNTVSQESTTDDSSPIIPTSESVTPYVTVTMVTTKPDDTVSQQSTTDKQSSRTVAVPTRGATPDVTYSGAPKTDVTTEAGISGSSDVTMLPSVSPSNSDSSHAAPTAEADTSTAQGPMVQETTQPPSAGTSTSTPPGSTHTLHDPTGLSAATSTDPTFHSSPHSTHNNANDLTSTAIPTTTDASGDDTGNTRTTVIAIASAMGAFVGVVVIVGVVAMVKSAAAAGTSAVAAAGAGNAWTLPTMVTQVPQHPVPVSYAPQYASHGNKMYSVPQSNWR